MGTVIVTRAGRRADRMRRYRVELDGTAVALVAHGERVVLDVEPGAHRLACRLDWARSNIELLDVAGDETIRFTVAPRAEGQGIARAIWYATLGCRGYLRLERAG